MICHPSMTRRALQLHPHLGRSRTEFIHRKAWEQSWQSANLLTSQDTGKKKKTKSLQKILFSPQLCLSKQRFSAYFLIPFLTTFGTVPNMEPNKASLPTCSPGSQWDLHSVKSSLLVWKFQYFLMIYRTAESIFPRLQCSKPMGLTVWA